MDKDKEDEVLPVEKKWGRLLQNHPYGPCPELEVLEEIAEKGRHASHYEERMQHIVSCETCREIIDQLRLLHTQWQQSDERTGEERPRFSLRRLLPSIGWPGFALAGGVAAILLIVLLFEKSHIASERFHSSQLEKQLVERDHRLQQMQQAQEQSGVKIADLEHALQTAANQPPRLVRNDKQYIELALNQPTVRIPEGYGGNRGTAHPLPLLPESPSETILRIMRPTFRWKKMPGAEEYKVRLIPFSGSGADALPETTGTIESPWQSGNTWPPVDNRGQKISLRPGKTYRWRVFWRTHEKQESPSALAVFETLDAQAEEGLENAALTLGIQQAQAGQLDDAEKEFQSVLAINPQNRAARKWSAILRAKRSAAGHPAP